MTAEGSKSAEKNGRKPLIIVAIPCFNEERFIGSVVLKARKYADKVLVIDDGSADASAEIGRSAGAVVYCHGQNMGVGAAIRTALLKAKELGADVLVTIDADAQHDADDIPRLIGPVLAGDADVVIGSRFLGTGVRPPFYRRLGQRVLNIASNVGSGTRITDSQSGFRAFSSKALQALRLSENGFAVDSEMQFAIEHKGLRVTEVPITALYVEKAKRNPMAHGLNVLSRILVLISLRQPLVLFGVPGIMFLSGGLALGARVLDIYSRTNQFAIGNALGSLLLCLTGILALFAALMLQSMKELLRREWEQLEKREVSLYREEEDNPDSKSK